MFRKVRVCQLAWKMGFVCGGKAVEDEVANLARGQIPESSVYHVGNWVSFTHKILGKRRVLLGFVFERIIPNVELREVSHEAVGKR